MTRGAAGGASCFSIIVLPGGYLLAAQKAVASAQS
jgi:hypothetical protein